MDESFLPFVYVTSFREQNETYINFLQWLTLVGLEPAYTSMWVARFTIVLWMPEEIEKYSEKCSEKKAHSLMLEE